MRNGGGVMGWNLSQFHSKTHSPPLICHPELASSVILSLSKDLTHCPVPEILRQAQDDSKGGLGVYDT
jgi:hypothetical protein